MPSSIKDSLIPLPQMGKDALVPELPTTLEGFMINPNHITIKNIVDGSPQELIETTHIESKIVCYVLGEPNQEKVTPEQAVQKAKGVKARLDDEQTRFAELNRNWFFDGGMPPQAQRALDEYRRARTPEELAEKRATFLESMKEYGVPENTSQIDLAAVTEWDRLSNVHMSGVIVDTTEPPTPITYKPLSNQQELPPLTGTVQSQAEQEALRNRLPINPFNT